MKFPAMATDRESTLERQIEKTKQALMALGDMRPGSLSTQYNVCGKAGCRCKADPPEKHGPYYQVSFTRKGKSSSKFVKRTICRRSASRSKTTSA
jgi:hypothetical protein